MSFQTRSQSAWIRKKESAVLMSDGKALFRRNGERAVCGRGRNEGYVLKNAERGAQGFLTRHALGDSLRKAKPFSQSLWARRMSFPQWSTWMKRRRICTFSLCPQGRRLNANKIYTRQSLLNFYSCRDARTIKRLQ